MPEETLSVPLHHPHDVPESLRDEVTDVLGRLAPLVADKVRHRREANFDALVDALTQGLHFRDIDVRLARRHAAALAAIVENSEWLTAEQIGELGGFSRSNLAAPASRWKKEGKLFALALDGQERFPRYGLDEAFRPLPGLKPVLAELGEIKPWRIAAWFESRNAWLDNRRPKERLAADPQAVLHAARRYRSGAHG